MAQRLRHTAQNINWTPEPIRPELLHFFDIPLIGSIAQPDKNFHFAPPSVPFEAIPSSSGRTSTRTPQPCLEKKSVPQPFLTYHRSRNSPACNQAGPSPSSAACNPASPMASVKGKITISASQLPPQGNDLKSPRGGLDPSVTEIGSPPDKLPRFTKKRSVPHARTKQVGWVNNGGIKPSSLNNLLVLPQKTSLNLHSLSDIPYNLRRWKHSNGADDPLAGPGNGKRKLSVSLLSDEIEEDFLKMTGEMPLRKLNKRSKKTEAQLDNLLPGMCFSQIAKKLKL